MDLAVRIDERLFQRLGGTQFLIVIVQMRQVVHGQLAGQFSRRMGSHPVRDHEDMPARRPSLFILGEHDREGILVHGPPHSDVGPDHVLQVGNEGWFGWFHRLLLRQKRRHATAVKSA